jgi:hypothetical protein
MHAAEAVAAAILYEGYVLYPYRASAQKNRLRWQVGLVTPRSFAESTGSDPWFTQTECLVDAGAGATLTVRARALHLQQRTVEEAVNRDGGEWRAVEAIDVGDRRLIGWDEAIVGEFTRERILLGGGSAARWVEPWILAEAHDEELVPDRAGHIVARLLRRRRAISAAVRIEIEPCGDLFKIRIRVENDTRCGARTLADRDDAVRQSLAGTHVMLAIEGGAFVSLLDPPPQHASLAASCANHHTFPILVGPAGSSDMMLSSPIMLYDHPAIAPESQGDFFDATEIDELLTLRVQTLTDREKQEARATDDRAARIIDRCEEATAQSMRALHGAIRHVDAWQSFLNPPDDAAPEASAIEIGSVRFCRGLRVRIEPSRRADSMDICLRGRLATVAAVYRTLEDAPYIAVILDDDPFGAAGESYRRSLFFHPDELVALPGSAS